jgi:hypothetical protein
MVSRDAEADLAVDFEAAGGGEEAEGWRAERVCGWEDDTAVVDAAGVRGWWGWAGNCEVPVVEV